MKISACTTMTGLRLPSTALCIIWCVIRVELSAATPKMDDIGLPSNVFDIHVEMQSGSTSLDLKSTIDGETKSLRKQLKTGVTENLEDENPIVARSTKVTGKSNAEPIPNYLADKFQVIENALKHIESKNQNACGNSNLGDLYLKGQPSVGVSYSHAKLLKSQKKYPKNCKEVQQNGDNVTGIYEIFPRFASEPFAVLCDMETKGGGWTHIQKRFDGSQDFYLGWRNYKFGFGDLEGEFWLGLEKIHLMTDFEITELLVEIVDRDNGSASAQYSSFAIGPEKNGYTLDRLSGFSGDAGDSLTYSLGQKFSTHDLDFTGTCATDYLGAWWYKSCHISNLNGKYINVDLPNKYKYQGLHWKTYRNHEYCHSKSRMLVRPVN